MIIPDRGSLGALKNVAGIVHHGVRSLFVALAPFALLHYGLSLRAIPSQP